MILHKVWCKCMKGKRFPLVERRKYLRFNVSVPIKYSVITKEKHTIAHPAQHSTLSRNIGGGGLMIEVPLLVDEFLMVKNVLKVEIDLPDWQDPIHARARMVCIERDDEEDMYYLRLEFVEIKENDRQRVISFVKKGLKRK